MATFQRCIDCENEGKDFVPMTTEPKHGLKRYVQTRNRDGDVVLTEDKGQNFLEWPRYVLASDYDSAVAVLRDIENGKDMSWQSIAARDWLREHGEEV